MLWTILRLAGLRFQTYPQQSVLYFVRGDGVLWFKFKIRHVLDDVISFG